MYFCHSKSQDVYCKSIKYRINHLIHSLWFMAMLFHSKAVRLRLVKYDATHEKTRHIPLVTRGISLIYFPLSSANIKSVCKFEFVVYYDHGYVDLVHKFAEDIMNRTVSEVKALSGYNVKGEVSNEIETFVTGSGKRHIFAHTK